MAGNRAHCTNACDAKRLRHHRRTHLLLATVMVVLAAWSACPCIALLPAHAAPDIHGGEPRSAAGPEPTSAQLASSSRSSAGSLTDSNADVAVDPSLIIDPSEDPSWPVSADLSTADDSSSYSGSSLDAGSETTDVTRGDSETTGKVDVLTWQHFGDAEEHTDHTTVSDTAVSDTAGPDGPKVPLQVLEAEPTSPTPSASASIPSMSDMQLTTMMGMDADALHSLSSFEQQLGALSDLSAAAPTHHSGLPPPLSPGVTLGAQSAGPAGSRSGDELSLSAAWALPMEVPSAGLPPTEELSAGAATELQGLGSGIGTDAAGDDGGVGGGDGSGGGDLPGSVDMRRCFEDLRWAEGHRQLGGEAVSITEW